MVASAIDLKKKITNFIVFKTVYHLNYGLKGKLVKIKGVRSDFRMGGQGRKKSQLLANVGGQIVLFKKHAKIGWVIAYPANPPLTPLKMHGIPGALLVISIYGCHYILNRGSTLE